MWTLKCNLWNYLSVDACYETGYMRSAQKVSSHVVWKMKTFSEEDRRGKKHCAQHSDASVPFKVGTLGPHTVLPIAISCPVLFSWISSMVWNLFLSKVILVLGKARRHRAPNVVCTGAESPGDLMFCKKTAWNVMHDWVCCCDEAANHQLPIAVAFWVIRIVSVEECSSLTQNWCRFVTLLTQSFWTWWPHGTHAHSMVSTASTD